ncbi:hypothetical protein H1235_03455 [Pseudoxanthomonas sp. NC8]|nr:hypothetical protein H1235_03455 [Pseudoxanthomonas sp. NC8]
MPAGNGPDFEKLDARWEARAPWPKAPEPSKSAAPEEDVPGPVPVGVTRSKRGTVAIFSVPGAGKVALGAGDALPGGGNVTHVSGLSVEWTDAKGELQRREMFNTYKVQEEAPPAPKSRRRR